MHKNAVCFVADWGQARTTRVPIDRPSLWEHVDLRTATLQVRRVKQSTLSTHPIFRRFVSSATEMARLANKPLRPLISDVLGRDCSCAVTRALQL